MVRHATLRWADTVALSNTGAPAGSHDGTFHVPKLMYKCYHYHFHFYYLLFTLNLFKYYFIIYFKSFSFLDRRRLNSSG